MCVGLTSLYPKWKGELCWLLVHLWGFYFFVCVCEIIDLLDTMSELFCYMVGAFCRLDSIIIPQVGLLRCRDDG